MESIVLTCERQLRVTTAEARAAVTRSLRAQQFSVTHEQVSSISAKRGSQLVGSVQPKKLPVTVRITLQPDETGCRLTIRLADAWRSGVGKVWGMNSPFSNVMEQIQRELDEALQPLAADGADFGTSQVATTTRDITLLSRANGVVGQAGAVIAEKADDLLDGPSASSTPRSLEEVVLRSPKGIACLDRDDVEGLFTVGLLISTRPGAMPANLARDVEALSARLEAVVSDQPRGHLTLEVSEDEVPVAEFLAQQAEIRSHLPVRTLQVCTTCKFEKIVNPDFQKLQERNHRKRALTGAVGATVSAKGVTPFLLIGSLLKLKNFDMPFVCPRCQGLDADTSIVTYCPECGDRRGEAVLRTCPKCAHHFAPGRRPKANFWGPEESHALAAPVMHALPAVVPGSVGSAATPVIGAFPALIPALPTTAAGWYVDTTGRHQHRYWDGAKWTAYVFDDGVQAKDPV